MLLGSPPDMVHGALLHRIAYWHNTVHNTHLLYTFSLLIAIAIFFIFSVEYCQYLRYNYGIFLMFRGVVVMALLRCEIRSNVLNMNTHINVILPHDTTKSNVPAKVLYLLHGLSDDCSKWTRYTALERKIDSKNLAVVMPEVQRSFYADMHYGLNYFQYVAYELPELCKNMFNISDMREDTFIAGLSMGGYGALKTALTRTDFFSKVASFSGAVAFKKTLDGGVNNIYGPERIKELIGICGQDAKLTEEDDPFFLAEKVLNEENVPDILLTCGTQDFLYNDNVKFKNHLEEIGYPAKFLQWEGNHNWKFWDESLDYLLEFLGV